jgi:hypothetical protein
MMALPQNQDLRFSGGRFSGWTQAELQVSGSALKQQMHLLSMSNE